MDIQSFLTTYGGPGGVVAVAVWFFLSDRKFSAERRAELRQDIDREQADNAALRNVISEKNRVISDLEEQVRRLRNGEDI